MTMRFDFASRVEACSFNPRAQARSFRLKPRSGFGEAHVNRLSNPELTILRKSTPVAQASEEHAVAPVRIGIGAISRHHPSFVQLYYAIEARRTSAMPLVVQFISPTPGTGASTVASGYARVAADDCAQPVLYIDCNPSKVKPRRGAAEPPLTTCPMLCAAVCRWPTRSCLCGVPRIYCGHASVRASVRCWHWAGIACNRCWTCCDPTIRS